MGWEARDGRLAWGGRWQGAAEADAKLKTKKFQKKKNLLKQKIKDGEKDKKALKGLYLKARAFF